MSRVKLFLVISATLALQSCGSSPETASTGNTRGRYVGVGIVDAGPLWAQNSRYKAGSEDRLAKIADDEHLIVVVDSFSGEIRQCGDRSGYCVRMNPWEADATSLPMDLSKTRSELQAEAEGEAAASTERTSPDSGGAQRKP